MLAISIDEGGLLRTLCALVSAWRTYMRQLNRLTTMDAFSVLAVFIIPAALLLVPAERALAEVRDDNLSLDNSHRRSSTYSGHSARRCQHWEMPERRSLSLPGKHFPSLHISPGLQHILSQKVLRMQPRAQIGRINKRVKRTREGNILKLMLRRTLSMSRSTTHL
jgi:hypothetical protein